MSSASRMMRLSFVIGVAMCATTVGCSNAKQPDVVQQGTAGGRTADRHAIDSIRTTMISAMLHGDAAAAAAIYDADAMYMPQGSKAFVGRPAIQSSFEATVAQVAFSKVAFTVQDVSLSGDLAVETGRYAYIATPKGGRPMPASGKYVVVLRKLPDGSWKVYRDIDNEDAPSATPATAP